MKFSGRLKLHLLELRLLTDRCVVAGPGLSSSSRGEGQYGGELELIQSTCTAGDIRRPAKLAEGGQASGCPHFRQTSPG